MSKAGAQATKDAGFRATPTKFGAPLEAEADARIVFLELLRRDAARPVLWVVDVVPAAPDAFQNDEVVEFPEQDHREGDVVEAFGRAPEALGDEAVFARRAQQIRRIGAVA